jgi:hypothetical protein
VPDKQLLMQIAVADDEVSNLASEYQARSMGIPVLAPSVSAPWGVDLVEGPVPSALVVFDFGLGDTIPISNEPPPDNDVHSNIRNKQATIDMMKRFYETGDIIQTCTGDRGCDCPANGCGTQL